MDNGILFQIFNARLQVIETLLQEKGITTKEELERLFMDLCKNSIEGKTQ